jgi:hypothetical protein
MTSGLLSAQIAEFAELNNSFGEHPLSVLREQSVLTDEKFGLVREQKEEISSLFNSFRLDYGDLQKSLVESGLQKLSAPQRREMKDEEFKRISQEYASKLAEVLTPEQNTYLLQRCIWNVTGNYVSIFRDPSLRKMLQLERPTLVEVDKALAKFEQSNRNLLIEQSEEHLLSIRAMFNEEQLKRIDDFVHDEVGQKSLNDFVDIEFAVSFFHSNLGREVCEWQSELRLVCQRAVELNKQLEQTKDEEKRRLLKLEFKPFMQEEFSPLFRDVLGEAKYSKLRWALLKRHSAPGVLAAGLTLELAEELEIPKATANAIQQANDDFQDRLEQRCENVNESQFEEILDLFNEDELNRFEKLLGDRPDFDMFAWSMIYGSR